MGASDGATSRVTRVTPLMPRKHATCSMPVTERGRNPPVDFSHVPFLGGCHVAWLDTWPGGDRPKHPLVSSYLGEKNRVYLESLRTESPRFSRARSGGGVFHRSGSEGSVVVPGSSTGSRVKSEGKPQHRLVFLLSYALSLARYLHPLFTLELSLFNVRIDEQNA